MWFLVSHARRISMIRSRRVRVLEETSQRSSLRLLLLLSLSLSRESPRRSAGDWQRGEWGLKSIGFDLINKGVQSCVRPNNQQHTMAEGGLSTGRLFCSAGRDPTNGRLLSSAASLREPLSLMIIPGGSEKLTSS